MALDNILIAIIHMLVSTIIALVAIIVILCVALIFATNQTHLCLIKSIKWSTVGIGSLLL